VSGPSVETCPECGAVLPDGGSCRDHFHALLLLEWDIPGGPGALPHFLAVATYGLQHPEGMGYTAETLAGLRASVADALDGRASIDDLRRRARRATNGAIRVTRRAGEPVVRWPVERWPLTVLDALNEGVEGYADRVARWARAVRATLDACG
jgi:hypothetical protein